MLTVLSGRLMYSVELAQEYPRAQAGVWSPLVFQLSAEEHTRGFEMLILHENPWAAPPSLSRATPLNFDTLRVH